MSTAFLISALGLGLLGSLHCLGMCGPLVLRMPFQSLTGAKKYLAILIYHLSKAFTYAVLGYIAGLFGKGFAIFRWQQGLSILAGITLLLITLWPTFKRYWVWPSFLQQRFGKVMLNTQVHQSLVHFSALGLLNGLLPCGLVFAALAGATVTTVPLHGALFMFLFGIGTIPALASLIFLGTLQLGRFRTYLFNSSKYLSLFIALLLILRGLNLGIPYISPSWNSQQQSIDCCHKEAR